MKYIFMILLFLTGCEVKPLPATVTLLQREGYRKVVTVHEFYEQNEDGT